MKRLICVGACLAIVILSSGCGFKKEKAAAEAVVANLFGKIQAGDFDGAVTMYSPQFFQQISRDEWKSMLGGLKRKLGSLQSYELTSSKVRKQTTASGSGVCCVLQYDVTYSNHSAQEAITVFKPKGGTYQILGHNVNSPALLND